uniref:Uncharacterized protein n=1 Tax=Hucho hucho TaxID=62062 RepID=A0A4W5LWX6_9TELE
MLHLVSSVNFDPSPSQILANPDHRFNTSSLYKNVTLVAWDPAPYAVNLHKWYASPDYNLFSPYVEHRRLHPTQPFYVLHPKYVWNLWNVIQGNTQETIQPNPPSSGFIGEAMYAHTCIHVHMHIHMYKCTCIHTLRTHTKTHTLTQVFYKAGSVVVMLTSESLRCGRPPLYGV